MRTELSHSPPLWPDPETFWQYAARVYKEGDLASVLVDAQDNAGLDVNIALLLLWADQFRLSLTGEAYEKLLEVSGQWQRDTLGPHRKRRRAAKGTADYETLLSAELALERMCQAALLESVAPSTAEKHASLKTYLESLLEPESAARLLQRLRSAHASAGYPTGGSQTGPTHG